MPIETVSAPAYRLVLIPKKYTPRTFPHSDRTFAAFSRMIFVGEGSLSPSFRSASYCPGGRGPRRIGGACPRREPRLPGEFWQGIGQGRSRFFKKPPREDAETICTKGRKYSKSRPPRGPQQIGLHGDHREWFKTRSVVRSEIFFKGPMEGRHRLSKGEDAKRPT
jgi:hypothetical protein